MYSTWIAVSPPARSRKETKWESSTRYKKIPIATSSRQAVAYHTALFGWIPVLLFFGIAFCE